jgi:hypothetical protein
LYKWRRPEDDDDADGRRKEVFGGLLPLLITLFVDKSTTINTNSAPKVNAKDAIVPDANLIVVCDIV